MQDFDRPLFFSVVILTLFGLVMVYSAGAAVGHYRFDEPLHYLVHQGEWLLIGGALFWFLVRTDYRRWEPFVWPLFVLSLVLLVAVLIPGGGVDVNGARRWLRIGGLTVQPAEVFKLALVALLAHNLPRKGECLRDFRNGLLPQLILVGLPTLLIFLQPDLGNAVVVAAVALLLIYLAGARVPHLALLVAMTLPVEDHRYRLPGAASRRLPRSVGRPHRQWLADHPIAHGPGQRRCFRHRARRRGAEALLSPRTSHGFHLFRGGGGARAPRYPRGGGLLPAFCLARIAGGDARADPLRPVPGCGDCGPRHPPSPAQHDGVHQPGAN